MSNSLLVLQSEHTELLKCVRTTSTVLRDVMGILRTQQLTDARPVSLQKLWHVCRSLDALAGLASNHFGDGAEGMEYYDEVDMDRALEGFSAACQQDPSPNQLSMDELAVPGRCCFPGECLHGCYYLNCLGGHGSTALVPASHGTSLQPNDAWYGCAWPPSRRSQASDSHWGECSNSWKCGKEVNPAQGMAACCIMHHFSMQELAGMPETKASCDSAGPPSRRSQASASHGVSPTGSASHQMQPPPQQRTGFFATLLRKIGLQRKESKDAAEQCVPHML